MKTTLTTSVLAAAVLLVGMNSSQGESLPMNASHAASPVGTHASPGLTAPKATVFGRGRYVALGSDGKLLCSTDGIEWAPAYVPVETFLRGVAFGNGRFVVVGGSYLGGGAIILTSINGRIWSQSRCPFREVLHSVACFGDRFIAVGAKGTILTSTPGRSWQKHHSGTDATFAAIACGNGRCVIGGDDGLMLLSRDALVWTRQTLGTSEYVGEITFDHDHFIATTGGVRFVSEDGSCWKTRGDDGVPEVDGPAHANVAASRPGSPE